MSNELKMKLRNGVYFIEPLETETHRRVYKNQAKYISFFFEADNKVFDRKRYERHKRRNKIKAIILLRAVLVLRGDTMIRRPAVDSHHTTSIYELILHYNFILRKLQSELEELLDNMMYQSSEILT
jgi:hypothetical protein